MAKKKPHRHGWNSYDGYKNIEQARLEGHPFVKSHNIEYEFYQSAGAQFLSISGTVLCHADVVLEVEKYLQGRRTPRGLILIRTFSYRYNASIPGKGNVLRYDNGHNFDEYHRHVFDVVTGKEITFEILDRQKFPTFPDILDELQAMFEASDDR
ncbi:MAG: hypothetical protein HYX92_18560 [Chloroflexi bacterium]|nr:hypothetical protein [Chloroflexota bacterium]